jgi:hypothetical protein
VTRATPQIGVDERRRRLAARHGLAVDAKAGSATDAARGVVVLHATDPASVFLQVRARMRDADVAGIERELYEERSLVRMLAMRRTLFVVPREIVPIVQSAASHAVARNQRRRLARFIEEHGIAPDGEAWLAEVLPATVRALAELGEAVSTEVSASEPRLREQMLLSPGKRYEARQSVAVPALNVLSAEGRIVRGRPRGTWISSQYRWTTAERWLGAPIPDLPVEQAQTHLVRLWLRSFGPATLTDIRWWTGWTLRDVKRAVEALETVDVDVDGVPGLALADDLEPTPPIAPWLGFLPALDPTTMGWQERDWYLGRHKPVLFDTNGNAGPTIWLDGRIVGGWTQRKDGEIAYRLLEDVGREAALTAEAEAARLRAWIGPTRFTMRFPSPLSRELAS